MERISAPIKRKLSERRGTTCTAAHGLIYDRASVKVHLHRALSLFTCLRVGIEYGLCWSVTYDAGNWSGRVGRLIWVLIESLVRVEQIVCFSQWQLRKCSLNLCYNFSGAVSKMNSFLFVPQSTLWLSISNKRTNNLQNDALWRPHWTYLFRISN